MKHSPSPCNQFSSSLAGSHPRARIGAMPSWHEGREGNSHCYDGQVVLLLKIALNVIYRALIAKIALCLHTALCFAVLRYVSQYSAMFYSTAQCLTISAMFCDQRNVLRSAQCFAISAMFHKQRDVSQGKAKIHSSRRRRRAEQASIIVLLANLMIWSPQ